MVEVDFVYFVFTIDSVHIDVCYVVNSCVDDICTGIDVGDHGVIDMNRKFTREDELRIIERYGGGESSNVIAVDYDTSPSVIMDILKRNGVETRDRKSSQAALLSDEQIDEICKKYRAGYTAAWLSREYGVSEKRIRKYLEKRGVKKSG